MTTFVYTARKKTGEKTSGEVDAGNRAEATQKIELNGCVPITIEEKSILDTTPMINCPFCAKEIPVNATKCNHCGQLIARIPEPRMVLAEIIHKTEVAGIGCLIQGIGLLTLPAGLLFGWGTGLILSIPLGILLLVYGSIQARFFVCSNCGTKLFDDSVHVCPSCKADFPLQ